MVPALPGTGNERHLMVHGIRNALTIRIVNDPFNNQIRNFARLLSATNGSITCPAHHADPATTYCGLQKHSKVVPVLGTYAIICVDPFDFNEMDAVT